MNTVTAYKPEISTAGSEMLAHWLNATERRERAKREDNESACALSNAENRLGQFLVPQDAKEGEPFHIWIGNGLLCAKRIADASYQVKWRKEPTTPR